MRTSRFQFIDLAGSERLNDAHGSHASTQAGSYNVGYCEGLSTNFGLMMLSQRMREVATAGKKGASAKKLVQMSFKTGGEPDLVPLLSETLAGCALSLICVCVSAAPANRSQSRNALDFGRVFSTLKVWPRTQPEVKLSVLRARASELVASGNAKGGGANARYTAVRKAQGEAGRKLGEVLAAITASAVFPKPLTP